MRVGNVAASCAPFLRVTAANWGSMAGINHGSGAGIARMNSSAGYRSQIGYTGGKWGGYLHLRMV